MLSSGDSTILENGFGFFSALSACEKDGFKDWIHKMAPLALQVAQKQDEIVENKSKKEKFILDDEESEEYEGEFKKEEIYEKMAAIAALGEFAKHDSKLFE
jgi:hypothetical protein